MTAIARQLSGPIDLVARGGLRLRLRPLEADDAAGLVALFERLGPNSRYRRFLSPKLTLSPSEARDLTDIDHDHHDAVAAVDVRDGSLVGVARYVRTSESGTMADIAVEVADDLHGCGIASALVREMIWRARERGIATLTGTMLWDNFPARQLATRMGFRVRASHGYQIEWVLELDGRTTAR
jgi:GNAT superfamily N-acetyltransferase